VGIAAFLCGLFYGAFLLAVQYKAEERKRFDRGMARLMADLWPSNEPCNCPECCDCEDDAELERAMEHLSSLHCHFEPMIIYGQCSGAAG
jgi:hypothetical protein